MLTKSHVRMVFGLCVALVLFVTITPAQGQADPLDAAALFKKKCAMCHGAEGKGFAAAKTPDFTSSEWQKSLTDEAITETVKSGKKGTSMPAFGSKLSEDEIKAVVAHVRSLGKK